MCKLDFYNLFLCIFGCNFDNSHLKTLFNGDRDNSKNENIYAMCLPCMTREEMVYVKSFPERSPSQVAMLALHAEEIGRVLRGCDLVVFPSVTAYDDTSISYSMVDCSAPLLDKVLAISCTEEEMKVAGAVLRKIHDADLLHSDYVPHNLFLSGDRLVLIDPHPPDNLEFQVGRLYGQPHNELAGFVFCLLTDCGLKRSLVFLGSQLRLTRAFLGGYGVNGMRTLWLLVAVANYASDVYRQKRRAGFSLPRALTHCFGASFLTVVMFGLA